MAATRRSVFRSISGIWAVLAVLTTLFTVVSDTPAQAAATLSVVKAAPARVLYGSSAPVTLTATNTGSDPAYNVSFRDVLPVGVTLAAATPAPTIVVNQPGTGQTTLIWENINDAQPGSSTSVSYSVTHSNGTDLPSNPLHAGDTYTSTAQVFANTDPRYVPDFAGNGQAVPGASSYDVSASASASTQIIPIKITKSEPSAEDELLRGVHDNSTVYTLTVTNNAIAATNAVFVDDYLPAQLEFLGCGALDNTPVGSSRPEYPGAPLLSDTPVVTTNCPTPTLVETVVDPAGLPTGVYTHVRWSVGSLGAGSVAAIRYAAGIPLRANALFDAVPTPPTPASLGQTANLGNNTGPTTAETSEQNLTNRASVLGTYSGYGGALATDATSLTRTSEDFAIRKRITGGGFDVNNGETVSWAVTLVTGEYRSASNVVTVDTLPDGYAYVAGTGRLRRLSPSPEGPTAVEPTIALPTNGTQVLTWDFASAPGTLGSGFVENAVYELTFDSMTLPNYRASGQPVASNDGLTNTVSATADTSPTTDVASLDSGQHSVADVSSAGQNSNWETITKSVVWPLTGSPVGLACDTPSNLASNGSPGWLPRFLPGDTICYRLNIEFPTDTRPRNTVVTDFLPINSEYVDSAAGPLNTVTIAGPPTIAPGLEGSAAWAVGELIGGARYTERGSEFDMFLATRLDPSPGLISNVDLTQNLLKAVSTNTAGESISLRASADFLTIEPDIDLTKGVKSINGANVATTPDNGNGSPTGRHDNKVIRAEDTVTFRVDVANVAPTDAGLAADASSVELVDIMPVGLDCATVSLGGAPRALTLTANNGDPFAAQTPSRTIGALTSALTAATCTDRAGQGSLIRWTVSSVPAGFSAEVNYDVSIPTGGSAPTAGEILDNTAGVSTYQAPRSDDGTFITYIPANNADPVSPGTPNTAAAHDQSRVQVDGTVNAKLAVTSLVESDNNAGTQVTPGEEITYTVRWTIPEGVSLRSPVSVTDVLPTNITYIPDTLNVAYGTDGTASPVSGCSNVNSCGPFAAGGLDFTVTTGTTISMTSSTGTYVNPIEAGTGEDVFTLTFTGRLTSGSRGSTVTNTATYSWRTSTGVTQSFTTNVANTVVRPNAAVTKTHSPAGPFSGGDSITYTLTVTNTGANASPLHDVQVTDCVPAGLTPTPGTPSTTSAAPSPAVTGTIGASGSCAGNGSLITWSFPSTFQLNRNATLTLSYGVTVVGTGGTLGAGGTATNTVTVTGDNFPATPATYPGVPSGQVTNTATTSDNVTMRTIAVDKSVAQPTRVAGQPADYTVTATIPAGLRLYDAVLVDTLPTNLASISGTPSAVTAGPGCVTLGGTAPHVLPTTSTQVGWWIGDIEAAPTQVCVLTVTYQATPTPAAIAGASLVNSAQLVWRDTNTDTNLTSIPATSGYPKNVADTATISTLKPALNIVKSANKSNVEAGDVVDYTLVLTNTGTAPAFDVQIRDTLPPGFGAPTSITNGGVYTPSAGAVPATIDWTLYTGTGGLDPASSITLTYRRRVSSAVALGAAGNLTNVADITSYFGDPDHIGPGYEAFDGNSDDATVLSRVPILAIVHTTSDGSDLRQSEIDQPFTWIARITNTGTGPAYGVDLRDALPANWEFLATTSITNNGTPVTVPTPTVSGTVGGGQTVEWTNIATLQPGAELVIQFTAKPLVAALPVPFTAGTLYTSTATASGSDFGGDALNEPSDPARATIRVADLAIDKRDADATFVIGVVGHYYLDVSNLGPDTEAGPITVTDTLPAGLVLAATPTTLGSGSNWACGGNAGDSTFTCTLVGVPPTGLASGAAIRTIDVPVNVLESALPGGASTGSVTNSASVDGTTYEVATANNSDSEPTPIARISDVAVAKVRTGGTMLAGEDQTYSITVTHVGPSPLTGVVTVSDPLPAGLRLMAMPSGTGWSCAGSTIGTGYTVATKGGVICTRTESLLAPSSTFAPITVVARIDPAATSPSSIVNVATVTSPNDPNPSNDTANVSVAPSPQATVTIDKSDGGAVFRVGEPNTYQIMVTNAGPSNEVGPVVVTDPIPVGMRLISAAGSGSPTAWDCTSSTPGTGTGSGATGRARCVHTPGADPFGPGEALDPILVTVEVGANAAPDPDPAVTNRITNTATVVALTDPSPSSDSTVTEIERVAQLVVDKTHDGGSVWDVGSTHGFTIAVTNTGPSPEAGPVFVSDTLPTGLRFVSATGAGWLCTHSGGTALGGGGSVGCTLPRTGGTSIAGNAAATLITVTVEVLPSAAPLLAPATNSVVNNVTAVGVTDPVLRSDSDSVGINPIADLQLAKAHIGQFVVGELGRFEFTVTNLGPSTAAGPITVTDTLPTGLLFHSNAGTGWACAASGQTVTCSNPADVVSLGSLPVLTIDVEAGPEAEAGVVNTAVAATPTADPVSGNNTDSDAVTATPSSDLRIVKSHVDPEYYVGVGASWTLQVSNLGPSANPGPIVVTDHLPAGMAITSGAQTGWDCGASTSTVLSCTLTTGALAAGAAADPIMLTASLTPAAVPVGDANALVVNRASVASPLLDRVTTNNTSEDPTLLVAAADLSIDKIVSAPIVQIGMDAEFLIRVTNHGPAPAIGVTVTDVVPSDLWLQGASGRGWLCDIDQRSNSLSCELPSRLEVGDTTDPIVVTALVSKVLHTVNSASVTSTLSDLVPDNNTDTAGVDGIMFHAPNIIVPDYPTVPPDREGGPTNEDRATPTTVAERTAGVSSSVPPMPETTVGAEPSRSAPTTRATRAGTTARGPSTTRKGDPVRSTSPSGGTKAIGSPTTRPAGEPATTPDSSSDEQQDPNVSADGITRVDGSTPESPPVSELSLTGSDATRSISWALGLMLCGLILLRVVRRRDRR